MRVGRLGTTSWPGWLERDSKDACKVSICIGMRRGGGGGWRAAGTVWGGGGGGGGGGGMESSRHRWRGGWI